MGLSNAGVEAMPTLFSYHVTLDRSYCDQAKFVVYITQFFATCHKTIGNYPYTNGSAVNKSVWLTSLGSHFGFSRHASFKFINKNGC